MNDVFLKACRKEVVPFTPVWFMRQAGRYMSEYRQLRAKYSLIEIAKTPELAAQVTLQPLQKFNLDAAIIFADILLPLEPMGIPFTFCKGEGPKIETPIRKKHQVDSIPNLKDAHSLSFVGEAISMVVKKIQVPLIGFAGGPFTLASYMIEGKGSRQYRYCKEFMFQNTKSWHALLEKISELTLSYLSMQIEAGAKAIQLFDSWIGCLSPEDYREYVLPHSQFILISLKEKYPNIPRIHFGTGTSQLLPLMYQAGANVMGIDWQTPLPYAQNILGNEIPLQGNLDPLALFGTHKLLKQKVEKIINEMKERNGHIFNLGHGILPETPEENVKFVIDLVHEYTQNT